MKEAANLKAEKVIRELRELVQSVNTSWWLIAERLRTIQREKLWEGRAESWSDFILDIIDKSERSVQRLIRAYEIGVIRLKKKPAELPPYSKFDEIAELLEATPAARVDEILDMAELPRKELRKWKREVKHGIDEVHCDHDIEEVKFKRCRKCKASFPWGYVKPAGKKAK